MRILFDLLGAQPKGSKFHGGGEYTKTVFRQLCDLLQEKDELWVFYNFSEFLDDWVLEIISNRHISAKNVSSYKQVSQILKENQIHVYYSGMPYESQLIDFPDYTIKIGTFHGLRRLEKIADKYEYLYYTGFKTVKPIMRYFCEDMLKTKRLLYYKRGLAEFDNIICVSNHTKYAIMCFFPELKLENLHVFYTPQKYTTDIKRLSLQVKEKYILLIGVNRWEKNSYRALVAIDELITRGMIRNYKIVTVGGIPKKIFNRINNKKAIIEFEYINAEVLESLYSNCDIFVYPSLNEGFGMPPLEAMKYGKTCIVSSVCSLPEVCGDAVYYFNPYDINEMQNRLLMAIDKKIAPEKIATHLKTIEKKQNEDLIRLCKFILQNRHH